MALRKRKAAGDGNTRATKVVKASADVRITRNMTTDAPRQAVFKTAELLEQILLFLPAKNLFGVQRVSRQFRDLVATSTPIQQKLFLKSTEVERQSWVFGSGTSVYDVFGGNPQDARFVKWSESVEKNHSGPKKWTPARLNPLLRMNSWSINRTTCQRVWGAQGDTVRPNFDFQPQTPGSWKSTFLTDPSTMSAHVYLQVYTGKGRSFRYGVIRVDVKDDTGKGLTLGAVMDASSSVKGIWYVRQTGEWEKLEDATLGDMMQKLGETDRKPAKCYAGASSLRLEGMVIPSEEEWESVK